MGIYGHEIIFQIGSFLRKNWHFWRFWKKTLAWTDFEEVDELQNFSDWVIFGEKLAFLAFLKKTLAWTDFEEIDELQHSYLGG